MLTLLPLVCLVPTQQTVFANYAPVTSKTFIVSLLVEFIGRYC